MASTAAYERISSDSSVSSFGDAGSPYSSVSEISSPSHSATSSYQQDEESEPSIPADDLSPLLQKAAAREKCSFLWWKASIPVIILHAILMFESFVVGYFVIYKEWDIKSWFSYAALGVYGGLLLMTEVCLLFAINLDPGRVDEDFNDPNLDICKACIPLRSKPERTHHCSTCGRCVLRMDHHCPWIKNCVGLKNLKAFLLLCTYTPLLAFVGIGLMGYHIEEYPIYNGDNVLDAVFITAAILIAFVFGLTLTAFVTNHYYLLFHNLTSLEYWNNRKRLEEAKGIYNLGCCARWCPVTQPRGEHVYNLGRFGNFIYVFGKNPLWWFFPFPTHLGDGHTWPDNRSLV